MLIPTILTNNILFAFWFQNLALFYGTEIVWSHFETNIIEIKGLSSQYRIAAWSFKEATLGIQKKLLHWPALWQVSFLFALIKKEIL